VAVVILQMATLVVAVLAAEAATALAARVSAY